MFIGNGVNIATQRPRSIPDTTLVTSPYYLNALCTDRFKTYKYRLQLVFEIVVCITCSCISLNDNALLCTFIHPDFNKTVFFFFERLLNIGCWALQFIHALLKCMLKVRTDTLISYLVQI